MKRIAGTEQTKKLTKNKTMNADARKIKAGKTRNMDVSKVKRQVKKKLIGVNLKKKQHKILPNKGPIK